MVVVLDRDTESFQFKTGETSDRTHADEIIFRKVTTEKIRDLLGVLLRHKDTVGRSFFHIVGCWLAAIVGIALSAAHKQQKATNSGQDC
jgi:hypothetical protein